MPVQKNLGMGLNRAGELLQKIAQGQHVLASKAVRGYLHAYGRIAQAAGIGQGLIRVAVGLEHIDDLKNDLARGLDTLS